MVTSTTGSLSNTAGSSLGILPVPLQFVSIAKPAAVQCRNIACHDNVMRRDVP